MSAHYRYLQIVTERPSILADFYREHFGMRELGHTDEGEIALTDGFYNLALVKPRGGNEELGLSQFGIEVDDVRDIEARLEEFGPRADIQQEPGGLCYGEYLLRDPNGVKVSLSGSHFHADGQERGVPNIRHIALAVPENDEVLRFYMEVFGFVENHRSQRNRREGRDTRWAVDGQTALAILPDPLKWTRDSDEEETTHRKRGLNHFGFVVSDVERYMALLPKDAISRRPEFVNSAEWRISDPDGNGMDISKAKGYEVGPDIWVRG